MAGSLADGVRFTNRKSRIMFVDERKICQQFTFLTNSHTITYEPRPLVSHNPHFPPNEAPATTNRRGDPAWSPTETAIQRRAGVPANRFAPRTLQDPCSVYRSCSPAIAPVGRSEWPRGPGQTLSFNQRPEMFQRLLNGAAVLKNGGTSQTTCF